MGYYTSFCLRVENQQLDDVVKKNIYNAIEELDEFELFDESENRWEVYTKWYSYREDMCSVSEKFPGILFSLWGDGEDRDDSWVEYYLDGKFQYCGSTLVYDEFDENKLIALP